MKVLYITIKIVIIFILSNSVFNYVNTLHNEITISIKGPENDNDYIYAKTFDTFLEAKQTLDIFIKKDGFIKIGYIKTYNITTVYYQTSEKLKLLEFKYPNQPLQ